uniref:Peptidase C1A papain C-terminal domain-containing protein n=1 Tax=Daphnia galeata TaxID=27404 RepID=A0A8J2REW2_9CRUS|nr:unnamed protein product [Daphnia galeata]
MLVDCDAYNHGCHGGDYTKAWQYIFEKGGAMKSSVYPYISGVNNQTVERIVHVQQFLGGCQSFILRLGIPYPNATASMAYLQSDGPLPTAMKILDSFFNYLSGVYSDPACIVADENDVDHAVVIVGYGTTAATSTIPATPYWIVRLRGTGWGLNGYFMIKRGVNMCNIESWTAYVRVV